MDTGTVIFVISEYANENYFDPVISWDKRELEKRSYQQWTAYEICNDIMDHPFVDPVTTIDRFILEMAVNTVKSDDKPSSFVFQTIFETAKEIRSLFV